MPCPVDNVASLPPLMSGVLELVDAKAPVRCKKVVVVVYKTSTQHFAAVFPFWGVDSSKRPIFCINLKWSKTETNQQKKELRIVPSSDGLPIVLRIAEGKHLESHPIDAWLSALRPEDGCKLERQNSLTDRRMYRQNSLSILSEEEED